MDAIAGTRVFAGADGVIGGWGLPGGALPLKTTPPKAGGPLETGFWGSTKICRAYCQSPEMHYLFVNKTFRSG